MKHWWLGVYLLIPVLPIRAATNLEQARTDHTYQFDQYRQAYGQYQISLGQYENIPTFAHEETLVETAKTMLILRAKVWSAYWQALRTEVAELSGIDAGIQATLLSQLIDRQQALIDHESRLSATATRAELSTLALEINGQQSDYSLTAYVTLGQIRKARLYYALSETLALANGLEQRIKEQIRDPDLQTARLRGLSEVQTILTQAITKVGGEAISLEDYTIAYRPNKRYEKTVGNLQPAYDQLVQAFALIQELATGIEW